MGRGGRRERGTARATCHVRCTLHVWAMDTDPFCGVCPSGLFRFTLTWRFNPNSARNFFPSEGRSASQFASLGVHLTSGRTPECRNCSPNSIRSAENGYLLDISLFRCAPFPLLVYEGSPQATFSGRPEPRGREPGPQRALLTPQVWR